MSKENEKVLSIAYRSKTESFDGFVKMKWQGTSSINFAKKNYTIKMYEDEALETKKKVDMKGWGKQNKFCLKANFVDITHARNIVSARLWSQIVASRSDADKAAFMTNSPNNGAVDGFPIKLYLNGKYEGLYTWNIPKDAWMFAMDEDNPDHCVLCAEQNNNGNNNLALGSEFRAECALNGSDWSVEVPSTATDGIKTGFNNLVSFVMNATDEEFKANLQNYANVQSLLDYFVQMITMYGNDSAAKNMLMATENGGGLWYACMYDMDSTWGQDQQQQAGKTNAYPSTYHDTNSLLWERMIKCFTEELKANYTRLRGSVLSWQNIFNEFERFGDVIGGELYAKDQTCGYTLPGTAWNSIDFIEKWTKERLAYTDTYFATLGETTVEPDEPEIPDEPDTPTEPEVPGDGDMYSLSEAITATGENGTGINTGVKPNSGAPDITLIVDFQLAAAASWGKTILDALGSASNAKGLRLAYGNNYLALSMQYGYDIQKCPSADLNRHKVGVSFDRTNKLVKIYADGELTRTVNNAGETLWLEDNEAEMCLLGAYNATHGTANCVNGTIYHCDLYSGVLTDAQIIAKMNSYI